MFYHLDVGTRSQAALVTNMKDVLTFSKPVDRGGAAPTPLDVWLFSGAENPEVVSNEYGDLTN